MSDMSAANRSRIANEVSSLDVGILVNNVGISYACPELYADLDEDRATKLISMNVETVTYMTRMVLPGMVQRKRGCIVNISSAASMITNPMLAGYSAAKAYIDQFSKGLNAEYASKGIDIQVQNPLYVVSKLSGIKRPRWDVPTPKQFVKNSLHFFGYEPQVIPFWAHRLQLAIATAVPATYLSPMLMKMHKSIRRRYQKKQERIAKGGKS